MEATTNGSSGERKANALVSSTANEDWVFSESHLDEHRSPLAKSQAEKFLFRYSVDMSCGGVVIAESKKAALRKVEARCKDSGDSPDEIIVWDVRTDDDYNIKHPDVIECYGL